AHLAEREAGRVLFDPATAEFVPVPVENTYTLARVYATDIDQVPAVIDRLQAAGYLASSLNKTQILEMQGYSQILTVLVWTIAVAVLGFGIWTVFCVFFDVTNRKRGAIGIMRIMGMPPEGIVCIMFVRALIVGASGAGVAMVIGVAIAAVI